MVVAGSCSLCKMRGDDLDIASISAETKIAHAVDICCQIVGRIRRALGRPREHLDGVAHAPSRFVWRCAASLEHPRRRGVPAGDDFGKHEHRERKIENHGAGELRRAQRSPSMSSSVVATTGAAFLRTPIERQRQCIARSHERAIGDELADR